jgi:acetyl esterase
MSRTMARLPIGVQAATARAVFAMPEPLRRAIAGSPIRVDGNELALDAQLLLRLVKLTEITLAESSPGEARQNLVAASPMAGGAPIQPIRARNLRIPTETGSLGARLYTPLDVPEGSALLVYFHGGGFVVGDLTTHDNTCRFLAKHAELRVLSVDYRLAPEHPFPAAPADALAAFEFAAHHAAELGADPGAIAVGGDSAGGNLAAVTSYQALRSDGPRPAFQLLFYPATEVGKATRSRELFADGYFLTDEDLNWFTGHYCPDREQWADPLASPLLAEDLHGMPPTYLATAGFDPLRDEGTAYAQRLRDAGVPVVYQCHADLIHGFVNFIGLGRRFREAVAEAAGALRTGLALRSHAHGDNLFGRPGNSRAKAEEKR